MRVGANLGLFIHVVPENHAMKTEEMLGAPRHQRQHQRRVFQKKDRAMVIVFFSTMNPVVREKT
jgi:hypothetical protein